MVALDEEHILVWREQRFEQLGLTYAEAWDLALSGVDWHEFAALVAAGCDPSLAAEILN